MQKKIEIKSFLAQKIACELAVLNCVSCEGNTCHGQSMRSQTLLRLCISVRGFFSESTPFTVINNYAKGGSVEISTLLVRIQHAPHHCVL